MAREQSRQIAEQWEPRSRELSPEAYEAALDALALAVPREGSEGDPPPQELDRLLSGFADELRKLAETLRTLEAFTQRMKGRQSESPSRVLH